MSARVMNPTMIIEMNSNNRGKRIAPNREALAKVRRDLFGPVDHAAARALADRELKAQSILDAKRWGFDFQLEIPKRNSRYEWEVIGPEQVVPEPYALRGMTYLRQHSEEGNESVESPSGSRQRGLSLSPMIVDDSRKMETSPQVPRLLDNHSEEFCHDNCRKIFRFPEATPPTVKKQSNITDFMKSRKRSLNTSRKSMVEPPEKITCNTGQIRS